jgi:branched-chain amino acid transport system permease protein
MPAGVSSGSVILGDFLFSRYRLMLLAVVAVVLLGVWLLLHKASFGRVVRAGIQRPDMVASARHPAAALHDRHRHARRRHGRAGRRTVFAPITIVHPAMGAESPHRRLRRGGDRRARQLLGRGDRRRFWSASCAASPFNFAPAAGEASMYVLMFLVLMFRPRGLLGERIEKFET